MEFIGIITLLAKLIFCVLLLYLAYISYVFIYIPWKMRRKLSKYPNVCMCKNRFPMFGDISMIFKNERENKFRFQHYVDMFHENPDLDMFYIQILNNSWINICSPKAFDEINKLIPSKVDRYHHHRMDEVNIIQKSFGLNQSTTNFEKRRKIVSKIVGVNFASKYIPMMTQAVDKWCASVKIGENLNLTAELSKITFNIIINILFGNGIYKMDKCEYYNPKDSSLCMLDFEDLYLRYTKDIEDPSYIVLGKLIPFLSTVNITEPHRSTERNKNTILSVLRKFVDQSDDEQSVYRQILSTGQLSNEEAFYDTILFMVAGFDAISHVTCSILYYLHKQPHLLNKLKDELNKISDIHTMQEDNLKDLYDQCDYLNYVAKEGLRIDPPAFASLYYFAKENIEICGVPIEKGCLISLNCMMAHFNTKEWHNPTEFIPERFDPESEYFFKPNTKNEQRSINSFNPFSVGIRNCAGQLLAKIELRIVLSRIISSLDFEIDKDQLKNDYAKFGIFSQMRVNGKIIKKHLKQ